MNKVEALIKAIKCRVNLERILLTFIWTPLVFMSLEIVKNIYYLQQIKPLMLEMEIIPLMFFFQIYYFNILVVVICAGFLLMYYHNRRKKGGQNNEYKKKRF